MNSRSRNVFRNMLTGVTVRFASIILPFITRTAILYSLGSTYLGLGTLFSSILSFLSLAELGIGSAISYAMYKPIAEKDIETICDLLGYIRKIYRRIGLVVLFVGGFIIPLLPLFIKGSVPENISVYVLYILYLINSSISYFFAGYRQVLLNAFQRTDILNVVLLSVNIFVYITQTIVVLATKNYYIFATIPIVGTLINNTLNSIITKRMFPEIHCTNKIRNVEKNSIKQRIGGLFGTRLNSLVVHQADVIVVSSFLGLEMVAIYGNYYYIMNAVCEVIMVLFTSMIASIGNKMVTDDVEQNYLLFKRITFFNEWIVTVASACFICLYQPFMNLWVGTKYMLDIWFVLLLVVYFFVYEIQRTILTFKDAAGIWREDQLRPYISMSINLIFNIILVNVIGIYGIVISTIIAFIISMPWANHVLFYSYFHRAPKENLIAICRSFIIAVIACGLSFICCFFQTHSIGGISIKLAIAIVVSNLVFLIINRRRYEIIYFKSLIKNMVIQISKKLGE